jgi:hypothetical protein
MKKSSRADPKFDLILPILFYRIKVWRCTDILLSASFRRIYLNFFSVMEARDKNTTKENRRTRLACDECHKRRIKCDGLSPCSQCVKNMTKCTISRKLAKRGPKAGHIEYLEARVKMLEAILTPEQMMILEQLENKPQDANVSLKSNTIRHRRYKDHLMMI